MRLLVTADLHYNHPRSRPLAQDLIEQMNATGGDVLLVIGDTAIADGDSLEQCLTRFHFAGPKLLVAGNHELWTTRSDSYQLFTEELPRRCAAIGWHWLNDHPFVAGPIGIVGSIGWYDYSFARPELGIPSRFYEHKVSPGVAERYEEYASLMRDSSDISSTAREIFARWNDGLHIKLGRSDERFLTELLETLNSQLQSLKDIPQIVAAIHCVPFAELLPPSHSIQWDFARAYLGSEKIGALLAQYPNVRHVFCGHSHFPVETHIGAIQAINIGSGYRAKFFRTIEL